MYQISKLSTKLGSLLPSIVFLWLGIWYSPTFLSFSLPSSWPGAFFTVSFLCFCCDLLWHSQHISVAAIKIAQKIIINIVGYNKSKRKKKENVQIYIYCTTYFAFHISRPETSADSFRCWLMIYANKNGDSSDMRAYIYVLYAFILSLNHELATRRPHQLERNSCA